MVEVKAGVRDQRFGLAHFRTGVREVKCVVLTEEKGLLDFYELELALVRLHKDLS
jgi:hypothetical protein